MQKLGARNWCEVAQFKSACPFRSAPGDYIKANTL